jgi:hypothetical protein
MASGGGTNDSHMKPICKGLLLLLASSLATTLADATFMERKTTIANLKTVDMNPILDAGLFAFTPPGNASKVQSSNLHSL